MVSIMPDNDVEGHFRELLLIVRSVAWRDLWELLDVVERTFEQLGIARDAPDLVVWQTCQTQGVILFTGNRNQESGESLETAIRTLNREDSLPVLTLANPRRFRQSRSYAERVAERFLECLIDLEHYRGSGRVFLP